MARLVSYDRNEHIAFNEAPIPSLSELIDRFPRGVRYDLPLGELPAEEEQRRAGLINLHGVDFARRRGYDPNARPPLETWLIGKPSSRGSLLAEWFDGEPQNYRLMIHRYPLSRVDDDRGMKPWHCWYNAYLRMKLTHKQRQPKALTEPVYELLDRVRDAYQSDECEVKEVIESAGHEYAYASLPTLERF